MSALLEISSAEVHFGGVRALDGVDAVLEPEKVYGLVGPNGSGKTTLVNVISGFVNLHGGDVRFGGTSLVEARPDQISKMGISRTFQSIRLVATLTVKENVMLAVENSAAYSSDRLGRFGSSRRASVAGIADHALARLDLQSVSHLRPLELPYGVQRRIEIARSLVSDPKLILLDEPFAGMSRAERDELAAVILGIASEGLTLLVIEHDLRVIQQLCNHLFVLNFGRCIAEGLPRETAALPVVQEAYLGRKHVTA